MRSVVGVAVALAALGFAGWRLMAAGGPEAYPDTEESTTAWMCAECAHVVHLTARERNEWTLSADRVRRGQQSDRIIPGAQQTVFRCEACRTYTLVRARECARHKQWHMLRGPDGTLVGCQACAEELGD
jgi:hypothetical protein